jgi:hypothetical protein
LLRHKQVGVLHSQVSLVKASLQFNSSRAGEDAVKGWALALVLFKALLVSSRICHAVEVAFLSQADVDVVNHNSSNRTPTRPWVWTRKMQAPRRLVAVAIVAVEVVRAVERSQTKAVLAEV